MSYEEAVSYLDALGIDAMKSLTPSLHRIEAICAELNHPESAVPAIHVAGTNGKTTTTRIAASVLHEAGLTVATFTSPHLQTIRERIALNRTPISRDEFAETFSYLRPYMTTVEDRLGEKLSYFEILTAMFFLWAADHADVAVVEVGLGGRWDATNVTQAPVGIITNIDIDHADLLGSDEVTIAREKAGIVKPGAVVVTGEREPRVVEVFSAEAAQLGAELDIFDRDFGLIGNDVAVGGRYISVRTRRQTYEDLYLPLHGGHQGVNAALALEAVDRFVHTPLDHHVVGGGLAAVEVPGRMETIRVDERPVVLDVAHNPAGISALVSAATGAFAVDDVTFVIGTLEDKDHRSMLMELQRLQTRLIVTEPRSPRAAPATTLARDAEELGMGATIAESVETAVRDAVATAGSSELIIVTGSHYVVGQARTALLGSVAL